MGKVPVRLYYAKLRNMGDLLNPLILRRCFGLESERRPFLTGELSAIGSGLGQFCYHGGTLMRTRQLVNGFTHPRVWVWGTGFISYADCQGRFFKRRMEFCALRGELSRRAVEKSTGRRLDIPTGDAGILASALLDEAPEKRWNLGIVPHLCDLKDPAVEKLLKRYENAVFIDVREDPLAVVRQIAQCRAILSSSLHGLIVADSFHIPNLHLVLGDRLLGDGYKFDDYYSAYGLPHRSWDLRFSPAPTLEQIQEQYAVTPAMAEEKKRLMLESFPRALLKRASWNNNRN